MNSKEDFTSDFFNFGHLKLNAYWINYEIFKFKHEAPCGKIEGKFEKVVRDMFNANVNREYEGFPKVNSEYHFELKVYRGLKVIYVCWKESNEIDRTQLLGAKGYLPKTKREILVD